MCGVYGFVGETTAVGPMVADALRVMEYRGYDSWGIGWDDGEQIRCLKRTGRVPADTGLRQTSRVAIGHTRWATHGAVTNENAHPHLSEDGSIAVVHNGVIENADALRAEYLADTTFHSETDSEILPHLIQREMSNGAEFAAAVKRAFCLLHGNSAIVALDRPSGTLVAISSRTPLRVGKREDGWELASDPLACVPHSAEIATVPDRHLVILQRDSAGFADLETGDICEPVWEPAPNAEDVDKGAFPHFTLKEIHDQPAIAGHLMKRVEDSRDLQNSLREAKHIIITGCGSAFYAGRLGAMLLQSRLVAWIDCLPASEISASTRNMGQHTLMLALTQSGETADVVDALAHATSWGARTAAILNTETSTVAKTVDHVLPIKAGVERSVLATKSFLAMVLRLMQLADVSEADEELEEQLQHSLSLSDLPRIAATIADQDSMIVLGKDQGYPIAQEAALKIKEGSYLHAEAFLTGELKHGPLALVESGTPCLIFATTSEEMAGARIAAAEVMSRGGYVIGFGDFQPHECSAIVHLPTDAWHAPLHHLVAAQTLAYHVAIARGVDPDFPRNLAKSVTVR